MPDQKTDMETCSKKGCTDTTVVTVRIEAQGGTAFQTFCLDHLDGAAEMLLELQRAVREDTLS